VKVAHQVYQDKRPMTMQIDGLMVKTTRSASRARCDRPGVDDAGTRILRPKAQAATPLSIGLAIFCMALGSASPETTWGQFTPVPSPNRRNAKAQANDAAQRPSPPPSTERQSTPPSTESPEYSSPDADHAVTGLRSRTTPTPAPTEEDTDADLPWSTGLTRRLWENRILAPNPNEDAETRAAMDDLIQRIRSVRFDDAMPPAASASAQPAPMAQPSSAVRSLQASPSDVDKPGPATSVPAEPAAGLTEAMQKRLDHVLHDPNQVGDPLEMAELLFLSGRPTEATVFYEKALARTLPNDSSMENDRAWILFQLGNCLRHSDMARAKEMYIKLVSEYPASPWTELAKAHGRLITWYQTAKPQQFMPEPSPK